MEGIGHRLGRAALAMGVIGLAVLVAVADAVFLLDVVRSANPSFPDWYTAEDLVARTVFWALVCWVATIPAFVVLWLLARRANVRASSLLVVAGIAAIAVGINGGRLQGLVFPPFSLVDSFDWDEVLLTPLVEELLKLLSVAIVMVAAGARTARAGIVLGAAAGLGMTAFETVHWLMGNYLLETTVSPGIVIALRYALLGLGMHATATALAGLGLGAWLERGRRRPDAWMPVAGLLGAVGMHAAWNAGSEHLLGAVLGMLLPVGEEQGMADTFAASSIISVVLLAGPWVVLAVAWRRAGPRHEVDPTDPAPLPPPA